LKAAGSTLAKRAISRSSAGARFAPSSAAFHYSARREEEAKETSSEIAESDGFMGTGLSHLYAIPAGVAFGVPILEFNWFNVNEETLLASTFLAFCVVAYSQGGDMIAKGFKSEADSMLKLQNDAEDEVITKMQENLEYMKLTENIVQDYQGVYDLTKVSYEKMNAAGAIKPQHDLKAQMEKCLSMISNEEQNAYEKAKTAMMTEATAVVTAKFADDKALKKAGMDSALAKLTGSGGSVDPVKAEFVNFFKASAVAAKKADDGSEEKEARKVMVAKMNSTAENEGWFFRLDGETGQPKMVV